MCRTLIWSTGTHDGSVALSMLELPGRGLAIATGANMTVGVGQYSSLGVRMSVSEGLSVENESPGSQSIWSQLLATSGKIVLIASPMAVAFAMWLRLHLISCCIEPSHLSSLRGESKYI